MIVIAEEYTPELCMKHQDSIFVFGDNLIGKGQAGQACIRYCPNAFGIPTKRLPSMAFYAFFSDQQEEMGAVREAIERLKYLAWSKNVVFPAAGIGTGLARMQEHSPKTWEWLCRALWEEFGYYNKIGVTQNVH